jgi:type I restriction enzyme M protein
MIKSGSVEAVIGLGPNLFYNSTMDSCLLVRNNRKSTERKGKVIFIDAYELIVDEKNNAHLSTAHQRKIFEAYKSFVNQEGFTIIKTEEEILSNEGSLKITDYLKRSVNVKNALPFPEAYKKWEEQSLDLNYSMNQLFFTLFLFALSNGFIFQKYRNIKFFLFNI